MKRILFGIAAASVLASGAIAADLPAKVYTKAPPPVVYDPWTGFYVGGNVGYSWGHTSTDYTTVDPAGPTVERNTDSIDMNNVIGGVQAGYNYRFKQNFLVGLEADIQASGEKGSADPLICHSNAVAPFTGVCDFGTINDNYTEKLEWFGTLRARAGYLITPTWLLYATGGLAYGRLTRSDNYIYFAQFFCTSGGVNGAGFCTPQSNSLSATNTGWTAGAGVEAEIKGNWTAKLEYLYMDLAGLGTQSIVLTSGNPSPINLTTNSHHFTDNILRVGVNYRFGVPAGAKY